MRVFADLDLAIELASRPASKLGAVRQWWSRTPGFEDRTWGVFFLLGGRFKRQMPNRTLKQFLLDWVPVVPETLEAVFAETGDFAATLASFLPNNIPNESQWSLSAVIQDFVLPLAHSGDEDRGRRMQTLWAGLSRRDAYLVHRLLMGSFKLAISRQLALKALSELQQVPVKVIAEAWRRGWTPSDGLHALFEGGDDSRSPNLGARPRAVITPTALAALPSLGPSLDYWIDWTWGGLRVRLEIEPDRLSLTDAEGKLLNSVFPEIVDAAANLAQQGSWVLDGELVVMRGDFPAEGQELSERLSTRRPNARLVAASPAVLLSDDLFVKEGEGWARAPYETRRKALAALLPNGMRQGHIRVAKPLGLSDWSAASIELKRVRLHGAAGMVLRNRRSLGAHWAVLPIQKLSLNAVLVAAERGEGRRSGLYTDYTLAVWQGTELRPVAKVYSGVTVAELRQIDQFVRTNTIKKLGAVRWVKPDLVLEIRYDDIAPSDEFASGWVLKSPRVQQIRSQAAVSRAATVSDLERIYKEISG